jgi:isochorismate pyruvate lyase
VVVSDTDREAVLRPLRDKIDGIDERLVSLIAERIGVVDQVVRIKQAHGLPARLDDRIEAVVANVRARAERLGAPPDLADVLWRTMIEWIIVYEDERLPSVGQKADPPT